jgi:hypothetical protein
MGGIIAQEFAIKYPRLVKSRTAALVALLT